MRKTVSKTGTLRLQVLSLALLGALDSGAAFASGLTELTLKKPSAAAVANSNPLDEKRLTGSVREAIVPTRPYSDPPVLITVSLSNQQMSVFEGLSQVHRTRISSGKKGHATPSGIFSILEKKKFHRSNLYNDAPMPFMQRLTWSGVALHRGRVPPFPASHGCVRIPKGMASTVFGKTRFGTHVIISAEELVPRPASHYNLFQPAEYNEVVASLRPVITHKFAVKKSDSSVNSDGKREPLRIYATRTSRKDKTLAIQRMLQEAGFGAGKPDGIYGRNTIKAVRAFQYFQGLKPTGTATEETLKRLRSVTYSQGVPDGILYVRQKHKPVYEAGFTIRNPQEPLGTHLALLAGLNEERADWISLTVPTRLKKTTIRDHGIDPVYRKQKVGVSIRIALDRIELPREARDFISQRLAPGTSFAISDNGLGTETGKGTDFIVQTY